MKSTTNGLSSRRLQPAPAPTVGIQLELPLSYGFFLRPAEAAHILHLSQSTIYQMIADGRLRAVNLNEGTTLRPCLRVPRTAVERKIREGEL